MGKKAQWEFGKIDHTVVQVAMTAGIGALTVAVDTLYQLVEHPGKLDSNQIILLTIFAFVSTLLHAGIRYYFTAAPPELAVVEPIVDGEEKKMEESIKSRITDGSKGST